MGKTLDLRKLKTEAEAAAVEASPADALDERTPVVPRDMTFTVSYDAPDGEVYAADLHSVILDSDGRMTKTRVMNGLTRGMTATTLPEGELLRLEALARVITQIKDAPEWVLDWAGQDLEFLSELNALLVRHENAYFRGNNRKGEGGALKPRISVDCPLFETAGLAAP
jgi:hypothetical protein